MSDAKESDWNDVGRSSGSAGMTKGASVSSGISEHSQIKAGNADMGQAHGQGQRPKPLPMSKSANHHGKSFTYK
ncbi:hypothetical protein [uncultured Paraglaciecola sp.]|uniref:hypothetical protein n=1 Tax=uncultured Paraglaciecola sp. TaxID=1765024 RepID=UPI0026363EFA|nr:hypothetical protein [uncultured Paraglaciecola sp.]